MVFWGHPRRWLILLGCGRASSLSPSIARLQQSLFIIFVSMEDSYLIGVFGSIRLLRRQSYFISKIDPENDHLIQNEGPLYNVLITNYGSHGLILMDYDR